MKTETAANVLGALALAITDGVVAAVAEGSGRPDTSAAALVHLSKYPEASVDALRKPLALSHPGCVRLVDRLEERRLVTRALGDDRRARSLRLTPAGASAAKRVLRRREVVLRRALGALSLREQRQLGHLASKMLASLVASEDEALAVCRVCDYEACPDDVCPVARALTS